MPTKADLAPQRAFDESLLGLGALIRNFRIRKELSQADLCKAIGWQDISMLSRLETGKGAKPDPQALDRIALFLSLEPDERGQLLLSAGHPASENELNDIAERAKGILEEWDQEQAAPAYVREFTWRLVEANRAALDVFGLVDEVDVLRNEHPNLLEVFFTKERERVRERLRAALGVDDSEWEDFLRKKIAHFKMANRLRTQDTWYQDLVQKLSRSEEFLRIWHSTFPVKDTDLKPQVDLTVRRKDGRTQGYLVFEKPLSTDPRFELVRYLRRKPRQVASINQESLVMGASAGRRSSR